MMSRVDPRLAALLGQELPVDWATRLLFSSPNATHFYAHRPRQYRDLETGDAVLFAYADILASCRADFRSFVSIGSGDGYVDLSLPLDWNTVRYFPVDISQTMVEAAVDAARRRGADVSGLVADAEDTGSFLESILRVEASPPRLVACLGNMLGNLDTGERALLVRLGALLTGPSCRLMLSVALGRFPRPIDRPTFDTRVGWSELCGLLADGVARRIGADPAKIQQAMSNRLVVAADASDVPSTDSLRLADGPSGATLLHLRRYSFASLLRWLEQALGLSVVATRDCALPGTDDVRLGIVLLARGAG